MEQASCKNCRNIDYSRKEEQEGRLVGKYRYGCRHCRSGYICGVISSDDKLEVLVCPGWNGDCKKTVDIQEITKHYDQRLQELYNRWNLWRQIGTPDAVISDGVSLNLLRKGIQALLKQMEDALPEEEYPECYYSPLPPLMDEAYMADVKGISKAAEWEIREYEANVDYQWIVMHYCELQNSDQETGQAYRLLCHKEALEEAIRDGDALAMKRVCGQKHLQDELSRCRKRMEKRLSSGRKRKSRKNGEKIPVTGQIDITELKVS